MSPLPFRERDRVRVGCANVDSGHSRAGVDTRPYVAAAGTKSQPYVIVSTEADPKVGF
jgi:hypothetical protein